MTSITVLAPRHVAAPRGAAWGAWIFRQALLAVTTLADVVRARAAKQGLAARVQDANRVRVYARSVAATDPGFSADLYAAADQHELAD